jgi:hypothetical protein
MVSTSTLLCICRDPSQLNLLKEKGYGLITVTNGSDGLRHLTSQSAKAVVLEYYLGLCNSAVVEDEIRQVRRHLPIIMVADDLEMPEVALKSVDALVTKSDGDHFLWETLHFVLNTKPGQRRDRKPSVRTTKAPRFGEASLGRKSERPQTPEVREEEFRPFSPELWKRIQNGTLQF